MEYSKWRIRLAMNKATFHTTPTNTPGLPIGPLRNTEHYKGALLYFF
jgi:hypothetical protein